MARTGTPADLTITPRDRRFGRGLRQDRWWMGGDPVATAFYNALSSTFPKGEAFFVESVRKFRDGTPEKLEREIRAFVSQEVMHSREHVAFNKRVVDAGYDISGLERVVAESLELTKNRPAILNLAVTMALEHYTAILASMMLRDPRYWRGVDPADAAMWKWHAIEEIEHKGVAYDTWLHATRDWTRWKRWKVKAKVMLYVTRNFIVDRTAGAMEILRQDGITGPKALATLLWHMWVRPGMFRKIAGAWAKFLLPGFHPWNEDDRHLLRAYEAEAAGSAPKRKVRRAA